MNINLTTKTILCLLVFLWIVFSIAYIINDIWSGYKDVQLVDAYNQGKADTINTLMQEAEKCQPVSVFSGEKEIQLMSTACMGAE